MLKTVKGFVVGNKSKILGGLAIAASAAVAGAVAIIGKKGLVTQPDDILEEIDDEQVITEEE